MANPKAVSDWRGDHRRVKSSDDLCDALTVRYTNLRRLHITRILGQLKCS
jgi:hypothetical protein